MIRVFLLAVLMTCFENDQAIAQEPKITFELENNSVFVGQPLILRIKVLVPTWMPKSPEFPNLEIPSLMVRLPERAAGPVSERIDGETWSGVRRAYRLYPLKAGEFLLPPGDLAIVFAEPGKPEPIAYSTPLPEIRFVATVPPGARNLTSPILASGFALEQEIEGETNLTVGDAVTRTLVASIEGTTPVLIPQLASTNDITALRAYPKDPVVAESEDRGTLSGTRTEVMTYVAQADGTAIIPELTIDWFNIETGKVETASVPEIRLTVTGAPPAPPEPAEIARMLGFAALALAIGWGMFKWLRPSLASWIETRRANWHNSERFAHRAVITTISARDLSAVMTALDHWKSFAPKSTGAEFSALETALAGVGEARFGTGDKGNESRCWKHLLGTYAETRTRVRATLHRQTAQTVLPPLNP